MTETRVPIPPFDLDVANSLDVVVAAGEIVADKELDSEEPAPEVREMAHDMLRGSGFMHDAEEADVIFNQLTGIIKKRWERDGEA